MTNEQQNQQVYLCVGNTGTGKSTFVRSMGGAVDPKELVASGGSLTSETTLYPAGPASSVLLVDTPGFGDSRSSDDPSEFSDSKHRANILKAFKLQKLSHFNGVYWFINDPKVTKQLEDQARYVNDLVNPEIHGSTANRSIGWLHVVVMLRGAATEGLAVKSVVEKVTGSAEVSERLCLKNIGLSLNGKNPGDCDLTIKGKTVGDFQGREILELQRLFKSEALGWFRATHPIKWTITHGKCLDCLQEGDPRAFGRCHKSIRRIHREKGKHHGIQILLHGPRDMKERTKSILKKVVIGLSATGLATGAIMTAAVTIMAPNPGTLVLTGTLLHMSISAVAITAGATVTTSASAAFSQTVVDPRAPAAMITSGKSQVTVEEIQQLSKDLKEFTTTRGQCETCHEMVNQPPCTYIWTCCKRPFRKGEDTLSEQDPMFDGCKPVCTNCNRILVEDVKSQESGDKTRDTSHKTEVPGCLNQCSGCGAIADEEDFSNNGCGTARHNLVYLPIYDEFC
ncbi:hypothetical protein KCU95_g9622, partial [Aureobasidium melanogenum]